jgi:hypothetical protein
MGLASGIAAGESGDVVLEKAFAGALVGGLTGGLMGAAEFGVNSYLKAGPSMNSQQLKKSLITPSNSNELTGASPEKALQKAGEYVLKQWLKTPPAHRIVGAVAPVVFSAEGYIVLTQTVSGVGVQDLDATVDAAKSLVDGRVFEFLKKEF